MIDYERLLKEMEAFREISLRANGSVRLKPYTLVHVRHETVLAQPVTYTIAPGDDPIIEHWTLLAVHSFMQPGCLLVNANARLIPALDSTEFHARALHPAFVHRDIKMWSPLVLTFLSEAPHGQKIDIMLAFERREIETLL